MQSVISQWKHNCPKNLGPNFGEFSCPMFSGNHVYLLFIQTFHFHQPLPEEHMV